METTQVSINGWLDKENLVYRYIRMYLCNNICTSWNVIQPQEWRKFCRLWQLMNGAWGHHAKWNKVKTDIVWPLLNVESNTHTHTWTHRKKQLVVARGRSGQCAKTVKGINVSYNIIPGDVMDDRVTVLLKETKWCCSLGWDYTLGLLRPSNVGLICIIFKYKKM